MMLLFKLILLTLGLISLMLIRYNKLFLDILTKMGNNCRDFIIENTGFFTLFFYMLFFIEQAAFILFTVLIFKVNAKAGAFIGVFALVVVTTASLQKFVWQSKYQYATKKTARIAQNNALVLDELKELIDENESLRNEKDALKIRLKKKR